MFKYVLALVFVVVAIEARPGKRSGSGSRSGSAELSKEKLSASDIHDELQTVKDTALEMSGAIKQVNELAENALTDPSGKGWEAFGAAMEKTFSEVSNRFDEELHRVSYLAEALWFDHNDLVKDEKCGFVAAVDKDKEDIAQVELAWALAMIQDLACMAGLFQSAEHIPFEIFQDSIHEDEANEVVQGVIWEMHKISRAGELFGQSMENIAQFLGLGEEDEQNQTVVTEPPKQSDDKKRMIERLMRALKSFSKK